MKCRNCRNDVSHVLVDLGTAPPSNSYLAADDLNSPELYFPVKVLVCEECFLVQMDEHEKTENIFNESYAYFSSFSKSWLDHAQAYSEKMIDRFKLDAKSFVVEVASNDGYLLQYFNNKSIPNLGVEPTASTAAVARKKGIETVEEFFGVSLAKDLSIKYGKADLIAGNNVLAHVPNLHDFVEGLALMLKPNGVVTLEFPHLMQLMQNNQFDTIYHEHFSYLSFEVVCGVLAKHNLKVFDVEEIETHGGSLRIFASLGSSSYSVENAVGQLLKKEQDEGMNRLDYYNDFQEKADRIKMTFLSFLLDAKTKKIKVAGYGAAAKGNTFLNFSGVKPDLLPFVVDASPYKQNKYLPGSRIPVVSLEQLEKYDPDFIIIFPWNLKKEIIGQLSSKFKKSKFVTFFPELEII